MSAQRNNIPIENFYLFCFNHQLSKFSNIMTSMKFLTYSNVENEGLKLK